MKLGLALIAAVVGSLSTPALAQQQQNCGARDTVVDRLSSKYGESRQSIGMAPKGRVVEVFASPKTGTWTITVTTPNGVMCLVASGQSYENLDEPAKPAGIRS